MRILVVEDEVAIADAIKEGLQQESYAVDVVYDGQEGYNSAISEDYDLLILDILLPGMNGLEVCRQLRLQGKHLPIIMLTAKNLEQDIVKGLDYGADDYLSKPFSFEVLLARIRALLRRPMSTLGEILTADDLTLNTTTHEVQRANQPINLSSKEYAILEYMLRNKNMVLSKNNIMTHVWDFDADILPNTVEVFINYLRAKIDKPFDPPALIQTVRGFGYKLGENS